MVYLLSANTLLFNDSEINEIPALFRGENLYETRPDGRLLATHSTLAYSMEPTWIDLEPAKQHLFMSEDDLNRINEINPANDGRYDIADDVNTWFSSRPFNSQGSGRIGVCAKRKHTVPSGRSSTACRAG